MIRKITAVVFAMLILCSALSFGASAADARGPIPVIGVYVWLETNPGVNYLKIKASYDNSALELINVMDSRLLAGFIPGQSISAYPYPAVWGNASDSDATGELLRMIFMVKIPSRDGIYPVDITAEASNQDMKFVNAKVFSSTYFFDEKGDVNGDGTVTAGDARLALRCSAQLEVLTDDAKKAADVDDDGNVYADDARKILRYSARLSLN